VPHPPREAFDSATGAIGAGSSWVLAAIAHQAEEAAAASSHSRPASDDREGADSLRLDPRSRLPAAARWAGQKGTGNPEDLSPSSAKDQSTNPWAPSASLGRANRRSGLSPPLQEQLESCCSPGRGRSPAAVETGPVRCSPLTSRSPRSPCPSPATRLTCAAPRRQASSALGDGVLVQGNLQLQGIEDTGGWLGSSLAAAQAEAESSTSATGHESTPPQTVVGPAAGRNGSGSGQHGCRQQTTHDRLAGQAPWRSSGSRAIAVPCCSAARAWARGAAHGASGGLPQGGLQPGAPTSTIDPRRRPGPWFRLCKRARA